MSYLTSNMLHLKTNDREENDFYATHPHAIEIFLDKLEQDNVVLHNKIWECSCGQGHISEVLKKYGYTVKSSDLIDRGYGEVQDFLTTTNKNLKMDIFTNPPFKFAKEFVYKAIETIAHGYFLGLFLDVSFLESKTRKKIFETIPPKYIYIYSTRQLCSKNADFKNLKCRSKFYIWIIWEKGYKGETITRWI